MAFRQGAQGARELLEVSLQLLAASVLLLQLLAPACALGFGLLLLLTELIGLSPQLLDPGLELRAPLGQLAAFGQALALQLMVCQPAEQALTPRLKGGDLLFQATPGDGAGRLAQVGQLELQGLALLGNHFCRFAIGHANGDLQLAQGRAAVLQGSCSLGGRLPSSRADAQPYPAAHRQLGAAIELNRFPRG